VKKTGLCGARSPSLGQGVQRGDRRTLTRNFEADSDTPSPRRPRGVRRFWITVSTVFISASTTSMSCLPRTFSSDSPPLESPTDANIPHDCFGTAKTALRVTGKTHRSALMYAPRQLYSPNTQK
jgi:hypothetical protein